MEPDAHGRGLRSRAGDLEYRYSVEGLFLRELASEVTPALRSKLREAGLDLSQVEPAYPAGQFSEFLRLTAAELYPSKDPYEGVRLLGARMLRGYRHTSVGIALFALMRVMGLERSLGRITESFNSGDNYTVARLNWLGPCEVEIHFNEVQDLPAYTHGILDQMMCYLGAKDAKVELRSCEDGREALFRIAWRR